MQMDEGRDSGDIRIEDRENMRMVSSYWFIRIVVYEPFRMSTAYPSSGMEKCEAMFLVASLLHS